MTYSCCTCSPFVLYIVCPDSRSRVGETSYGMWVGFIESDIVIIYLFIYLNLKKKSALFQVINYQLFHLLSLEFNSHILETNSHFSPELLICALGDLTMRNLAYKARLLEWQHQTLFGQYRISLIYLFFILGSGFACVRLLPFILYYIVSTSCCPWISGIS